MTNKAARERISPIASPAETSLTYVDSAIIDYVKTINQTFYDQVKTADQKAAYVFTFLVAILIFWSSDIKKGLGGIVLSDLISLRWFLIFPRVRPSNVALFWGAWPAAADRLRNVPDFTASHFVVEEYIENIYHLAAICQHKYQYVSFAYRGLLATILFHISILTLG